MVGVKKKSIEEKKEDISEPLGIRWTRGGKKSPVVGFKVFCFFFGSTLMNRTSQLAQW